MPTPWFVVTGVLLISIALSGTVLKRLPLTASMFYLAAGAMLGPWGANLLDLDAIEDAAVVERVSEVAVIISLFTAGLKLRLPFSDPRWRTAIVLATVAMILTIGAIAARIRLTFFCWMRQRPKSIQVEASRRSSRRVAMCDAHRRVA